MLNERGEVMTRFIVITITAAAIAIAFAFAGHSDAAVSAGDPRVGALQKQVRALQAQVKVLQRRVANDEGQLSLNFEGDTCLGAQVADLIQGTWMVVDQLSVATQAGKTYFGLQQPVDDYKNCADLARPDVPRPGIVVPPTIEPLRPLQQWLHEPLD